MRSKGRFSYSAIFFLSIFLAGYYYSHSLLFTLDTLQSRSDARKWNMPTVVVTVLAGEFQGLMADLLLMESAALFGTSIQKIKGGGYVAVNSKPDLVTILRLLNHSIALDPCFKQTYQSAQGWLPWYGDQYVTETNKILKVAEQARWWDWQPSRFIGFNSYYFSNDIGGAGKIYLEASKIRNAPPFLAILGARLAQQGNETSAAIDIMKDMLQNKNESDPSYSQIVDRLHSLEGTLAIEVGVKQFRERFGAVPETPNDLLEAGILLKIPHNPNKMPFCIDGSGAVFFDQPNCKQ